MLRVYAPEGPESGLIELEKDEAHHLVRVRRVMDGERVEAFDGKGNAWSAEVAEVGKNHCLLRVIDQTGQFHTTSHQSEIIIATAVPKGDRFDWLVEKATELGVSRLVPLRCDRSVVDPRDSKIDRLRQLVVEACKQSGRNLLMQIDQPIGLTDYLNSAFGQSDETKMLWADQAGQPAARLLAEIDQTKHRAILIGPEGGWSEAERELFQHRQMESIRLANHILRIETAATAAAAILAGGVGTSAAH